MGTEQKEIARCPKCKKALNYLDLESLENVAYRFTSKGVKDTGSVLDVQHETYSCPECHSELFTDKDKAEKFFENKRIKVGGYDAN